MKQEYIVDLKGKKYPTYPGILDEAHENGLLEIRTELVQPPTEENGNVAIVKAIISMFNRNSENAELIKKYFEAYGDASPQNVSSFLTSALIRMAETRAKGRALRDAVNVGDTMLEELPDDQNGSNSSETAKKPSIPTPPTKTPENPKSEQVTDYKKALNTLLAAKSIEDKATYLKEQYPTHYAAKLWKEIYDKETATTTN